ncbi:MAG: hypothetical protein AB7I27_04340 [Bacteriovoracaceae bacterium]
MRQMIFLTIFLSGMVQAENNCPATIRLKDRAVQDQDGVGECYSNTGSLMLQYRLNLEKFPSYLQMSISASLRNNQKKTFVSPNADDEKKVELFNEGGFICDAINTAKDIGWCDSEMFGPEFHNSNDYFDIQSKYLKGIGELLDKNSDLLIKLSELAKSGKEDELRDRLASLLYENEQLCSQSGAEYFAGKAIQRLQFRWRKKLNTLKGEKALTMKKIYDLAFDQIGRPIPAFKKFVQQMIDPDLEHKLKDYKFNNKKIDILDENKLLGLWGYYKKIPAYDLIDPNWSKYNDENFQQDYQEYSRCLVVSGKADVLERFIKNPSCSVAPDYVPNELVEESSKILKALIQVAQISDSSRLTYFLSIVAPKCEEQIKARQIQKKMDVPRCSSLDVKDVKEAANKVDSELCVGRPVGVGICMSALKSKAIIDTQFCNQQIRESLPKKLQGKHAITIIGYRPGKGDSKMYLIQNSWGRSCPFLEDGQIPEQLKDHVECEKEPLIGYTGRFWMSEELLFKNSMSLSYFDN